MRRQRGFTFIELLVVIAIVGGLLGTAVYGLRSVAKSRLRSASGKLAATIRSCYDRSLATGWYYRLVIELDGEKGFRYWPEQSKERAYIKDDKEQSPGRGKAFDVDAAAKRQAADDLRAEEAIESQALATAGGSGNGQGLLGGLLPIEPPPRPKRAKFSTFEDAVTRAGSVGKVASGVWAEVYTPRQPEPYTQGRAYLYFFPDGHTERAMIYLRDSSDYYSLIVSPLSGRVEVINGKVDLPRDFDTKDLTR